MKPEQIAARLSSPQREAVLRGGIGDQTIATVRALHRKGLMYHDIDSPNGRCGPMRLTELGTKVRDIILKGPCA